MLFQIALMARELRSVYCFLSPKDIILFSDDLLKDVAKNTFIFGRLFECSIEKGFLARKKGIYSHTMDKWPRVSASGPQFRVVRAS